MQHCSDSRCNASFGIAITEGARIEPFDAIELERTMFWADAPLPTRASEPMAPCGYSVREP
jgi:hypothetical protein